ncbi:MAG: GNAT family N-acetyltransferase [Acidobacteriota bacterium]
MPVNNTEPLSVYRAGPGYAPCLAEMILLATRAQHKRGILDFLLGLPEPVILRVMARLAMHPAQAWGRIDNTFVALVDGVCSGTATARPADPFGDFPYTPEPFREVAAELHIEPELVEAALERQKRLLYWLSPGDEPEPEGMWLLEYLAVRRPFRAGGVARGLMERVMQEVRAAGGSGLELYCEIGNVQAERLYATLGFSVLREYIYDEAAVGFHGVGVRQLRIMFA